MGKHAGFEKLVADAKKHITEISPQDGDLKGTKYADSVLFGSRPSHSNIIRT